MRMWLSCAGLCLLTRRLSPAGHFRNRRQALRWDRVGAFRTDAHAIAVESDLAIADDAALDGVDVSSLPKTDSGAPWLRPTDRMYRVSCLRLALTG
jgi:hypothetical protein